VDSQALPAGYKLHWYEIQRVLGKGGFGITYLAFDSNLAQQVAIKEYFPGQLAARDQTRVSAISENHQEDYAWGLSRFVSEAQTLAQFRHPAIVPVYTTFSENLTAYMVMEYITGESCGDVFRHGKYMSEDWLLNFLESILGGLRLIHERGFIHRDIKPDNISLRDDQSPVLLDFGSARMAVESKTQSLTALVTPGFAPFEQYHTDDQAGRQGPWTDIYSLAATCYVGIAQTRRLPDALARINAMLTDKPDPLTPAVQIGEGRFSEALLSALDAALRIQPGDRPQSVDEWLAMLPLKTVDRSSPTSETGRRPGTSARDIAHDQVTAFGENDTTHLAPEAVAIARGASGEHGNAGRRFRVGPWIAAGAGVVALAAAGSAYFLLSRETTVPVRPPIATAGKVPAAAGPSEEEDAAISVRDTQIEAFLALAKAAVLDGRLVKPQERNALSFYRQALELDPQNQRALKGIVNVMDGVATSARRAIAQEEFEDADEFLTIILSVRPDNEKLANLRGRLGTARQSVEQREREARLLTERVATAVAKGRAALEQRRLSAPAGDNALEYFQAALALAPDNAEAQAGKRQIMAAHLAQAQVALDREDLAAAKASVANAAAIESADARIEAARAAIAAAQVRMGERATANQVARLLTTAEQHRGAGRLTAPADNNALQSLRSALTLSPESAEAQQGLRHLSGDLLAAAVTATEAGAFEQAQGQLLLAADILPQEPASAELRARIVRATATARQKLATRLELEKRTRDVLLQAATDLAAGRLLQPPKTNAVERYGAVLKADPENAEAKAGMQRVAERLVALADDAILAGQLGRTRSLLAAATKAWPVAPGLIDARLREQAALDRQQRVEALLSDGQAQLRASRLSAPPRRNALESFSAALVLAPDNSAARAGLSVIVERFATLAISAVDNNRLEQARAYLQTAGNIASESDAALLMQAQAAYEKKLIAVAAADRATQVRRILETANADLAAGRLRTPSGGNALERFAQALRLDPSNAEARVGIERVAGAFVALAETAIDAGQLDAAGEHLANAEQVATDSASLRPARQRLQAAVTDRERRLKAERDRRTRIDALLRAAQADLAAGRLSAPAEGNALDRFKATLVLEPGNDAALSGVKQVLNRHLDNAGTAITAQDFDAAAAQLNAAAAIEAEAPAVNEARARLAAARERVQVGRVRARVAELINQGKAALDSGNLSVPGESSALELYREALGLAPNSAAAADGVQQVFEALVARAEGALASSNLDQAEVNVAKATDIDPQAGEVTALRARISAVRAAAAQREQLALQVRELVTQAGHELAQGDDEVALDRAATRLRQALRLQPDDPRASTVAEQVVEKYQRLVAKALEETRFDEAEALIAAARKLLPKSRQLVDEAAKIAAARDAARGAAEQSAKVKTLLAQAEKHLARLRLTTPPAGNAAANYREVLELEPDNAEAKLGLERIVASYMVLTERALKRGNDTKMRSYLDTAAQIIPDYGGSRARADKLQTVLRERAELAGQRERDAQAAKLAATVRAQSLLDSARRHLGAGRLGQAETDAKAALRIERGNRDANDLLAAIGAQRAKANKAGDPPPVTVKKVVPVATIEPPPDKPPAVTREPPPAPLVKTSPKRTLPIVSLTATWCASSVRMRLTPNQWTFMVGSGNNLQFAIERIETSANAIDVYWVDDKRRSMVTQFGRFSPDGSRMVQLRGKVRSSSSWSQYNRSFTRCD
jgi:serine/threonine protein kinase/tetratricopeptide (TPR) repeat protein